MLIFCGFQILTYFPWHCLERAKPIDLQEEITGEVETTNIIVKYIHIKSWSFCILIFIWILENLNFELSQQLQI